MLFLLELCILKGNIYNIENLIHNYREVINVERIGGSDQCEFDLVRDQTIKGLKDDFIHINTRKYENKCYVKNIFMDS